MLLIGKVASMTLCLYSVLFTLIALQMPLSYIVLGWSDLYAIMLLVFAAIPFTDFAALLGQSGAPTPARRAVCGASCIATAIIMLCLGAILTGEIMGYFGGLPPSALDDWWLLGWLLGLPILLGAVTAANLLAVALHGEPQAKQADDVSTKEAT